ncbi:MAG: C40 family peptidase [Burkholderiaceae bacterium]|jgi:cell wall-associated NlpC family hydrolase
MTDADDRMAFTGRRAAAATLLGLPLWLAGCAGPQPVRPRSATAGRSRPGGNAVRVGEAAGAEVVVRAMALIGVPYHWGGDDPDDGFDCSGLVTHVFREATGLKLPRTSRLISEHGRQIGRGGLRESDLVFFNTNRRAWSHVGIYVGGNRFVHAPSTGSLVRLDSLDQRYWRDRYNGARRLIEV